MTMLKQPITVCVAGALFVVTACVQMMPSGEELVATCQAAVNPTGTYEYDTGLAIPVVTPTGSGTEAGARAMNSCIRAKAEAAGMIALTSTSGLTGGVCPNDAPTLYGGATYCIGAN